MIVRSTKFNSVLFCVFLLISIVKPSVLKEALEEHLEDVAHNDEDETIKHQREKSENDHHIDSQIHDSHTNQNTKASDDVKYTKKDIESKVVSDKAAHAGYNSEQDKSEDTESSGFKRGHKKGHHKQGFQNSYHKEESSTKNTFFDDVNDEGDVTGYNSKLNSHDNQYGKNYQGSHNNGQEYLRNNYEGGGHNRYGDNSVKRYNHLDNGRKHYLDDSELHDRYRNDRVSYDRDKSHDRHEYRIPQRHHNPNWDRHRWHDRRDWHRPQWNRDAGWGGDYTGAGYYDDRGVHYDGDYGYDPNHYRYGESQDTLVAAIPKDAPVVARRKQTITIYEDPRYTGDDAGQLRREEGDYLQLDIQPSSRRYASYGDTYYSAPAKTAEASKINKLVYNYKGH